MYAQPHLAFGAVSGLGRSGGTGVASVSGLVDLTLIHRIFIGAGGGVGVLNNPGGPLLHFRLGGYPIQGFGNNGYARMGLMVGADLKIFFVTDLGNNVIAVQPMFSIGYEAY